MHPSTGISGSPCVAWIGWVPHAIGACTWDRQAADRSGSRGPEPMRTLLGTRRFLFKGGASNPTTCAPRQPAFARCLSPLILVDLLHRNWSGVGHAGAVLLNGGVDDIAATMHPPAPLGSRPLSGSWGASPAGSVPALEGTTTRPEGHSCQASGRHGSAVESGQQRGSGVHGDWGYWGASCGRHHRRRGAPITICPAPGVGTVRCAQMARRCVRASLKVRNVTR